MEKIVLAGKPNVGKSTLLNKLGGKRVAITTDIPGTTRDTNRVIVKYGKKSFELLDPAGIVEKPLSELDKKTKETAEKEIAEANWIIFMTDAITGVTKEDQALARRLRRLNKEIVLVVNKAERKEHQSEKGDFYRLGFGEPLFISAKGGTGLDLLKKQIAENVASEVPAVEAENTINVVIMGRPNVGKSSFLNKLIATEKYLVSETAGTTRDINTETIKHKDANIKFLDTAGLRRRGKVGKVAGSKTEGIIEKFAVDRTKSTLEKADIGLLLIDAADGITAQDTHVAGDIIKNGKGIVIVVNKWDLATTEVEETLSAQDKFLRYARRKLQFLGYAPLVFVSSLTGKNIEKVLDIVLEIATERVKQIKTSELNSFLEDLNSSHIGAPQKGKKIKYVTQVGTNPPTFAFFARNPKEIHFSYRRFIENQMRKRWNFTGTPIKLIFREK